MVDEKLSFLWKFHQENGDESFVTLPIVLAK
jgi:hypothetical protein